MMDIQKRLRTNAKAQRAFRERQIDEGRILLKVWLSFDSRRNLEAIAHKRRMTIEQAIDQAINGEWEAAGSP